ncbi:Vacuolar amino acid transporter 3 [Cytospora mali]|uniref:Vacuolar amino acid transporter 3 n=1 Tax=Cytospora mali TaxID=578113 RepID=A0A194VA97_CYTMA|nr:Vacuolar amino acid transporter 3 [Valsa mali var. pyri (nom. inval.)]
MSNTGKDPAGQPPLEFSRPASPGSFGGRSYGTSVPRADTTARLAAGPIRSHQYGTPPTGRSVSAQRSGDVGVGAGSSSSGEVTPLPGATGSSAAPGPGISALAAALSNSLGASPPRFGTPPARPQSPSASSVQIPQSATPTNYGSFDTRGRNGAYEDPEIIKRHLVQPSDAAYQSDDMSIRRPSDAGGKGKQPETGMDEEFSSLRLQGGDITRPIYKWTEEATNKVQRSKSFSMPRPGPEDEVLDIHNIKVPGGFRRNYLRRNAGSPAPNGDGLEHGEGSGRAQPQVFTSSFLEFLSIYGHFAGEELQEDDEVLKPGEYFSSGEDEWESDEDSDMDRDPMEDSALLTPSRRKRRRRHRGGSGKASPTGAALVLLKSFVGTGVLFLPRAYLNGGMVFSNLVLLFVAALSYYCFVLLVTSRLKVEGSFGDMGGILYGKWLRNLILSSIVISQIGFVAAYIVFVSENLQAFILAVSDCQTNIQVKWLILMQMIIFLPFSLFRDINKLSFTAFIADAFIILGLGYLFYYDVLTLDKFGLADIILFNKNDWTLFIGTAIFTFEGIGLIIPIQESMADPRKFPKVMFIVMIIITLLFTVMGAISYAAYGSSTETVVLLNLPQDNKLVNGVQFLYSIAIMLSTPLQIFPAIRILENGLFTRSGKYNPYIKWQKNIFRFAFVILCALIAWGGADDLDKFVALVGNFACIPLVYIYPPMLHYRAVARTSFWKISDIILCIFGFIAMAYTTALTLTSWAGGETGPSLPGYCDRRNA